MLRYITIIALYFLKKDEEQVVAYFNLPNIDTVRYIKDSVVSIMVTEFIQDYNDEDDSE